ncbi:MAG TPA: hypothetical protein VFV59_01695 [Candidatus Limnocylindria bacterium]|nr:hypothetical protein [Candidatus Limnocylindria bacterium]
MTDQNANVTSGETHGQDQEPREVGAADPAVRDPRPDGPMKQPVDPEAASDEFGASPDAAYGQREGQADPETGSLPDR